MRRILRMAVLALPLVAGGAVAQGGGAAPHEWLYGSWTGGLYPAGDPTAPSCLAQPSVIFTRDIILRAGLIDLGYRQRAIETVSVDAGGVVEIRLLPAPPVPGLGGRAAPDPGFGCTGNANLLRVERRGGNEIAFPGCTEFPLALRRCGVP